MTDEKMQELQKRMQELLGEEYWTDMIREPEPAYQFRMEKQQGEYTVEDYLAWPEEERIELIDGVIYDMAAPIDVHQIITGRVFAAFLDYIMKNKGECVPVVSPIDVQLDQDNKTMVQPDVIIVCDRNKFQNGRIFGAPDLVAEVLFPSTRRKDMTKKLQKYQNAGVREYWMVDPKDRRVTVHFNMDTEDIGTAIYTFNDIVPVKMFDGQCEVNFKEIAEYISFLS